jgi:hypothetical protein
MRPPSAPRQRLPCSLRPLELFAAGGELGSGLPPRRCARGRLEAGAVWSSDLGAPLLTSGGGLPGSLPPSPACLLRTPSHALPLLFAVDHR